MATYELTGTVKLLMDQQTFDSGFSKREFVVTSEGERFPQDIKFECLKEKCSLLDGVEPGQRVTVSFDLRGREYNGRYFVNLNAWRIQAAADEGSGGTPEDEGPPIELMDDPGADELDGPTPF